MPMIDLVPIQDDSGGVRIEGGPLEHHFSTIDDLKTRLRQAHIDPTRYESELLQLQRGNRTRLAVSSLQLRAFYAGITQ